MKFECYYDSTRFAYLKSLFDKNGFSQVGSHLPNMRKVAIFICDKFNVYIDCIDREYPLSAKGVVEHANGKPFLYLKTAYSPTGSKEIIDIIESGGGKIEPFFKWCGANLDDKFYKKVYPVRKELILKNRSSNKKYDLGFWSLYELTPQRIKSIASHFYHRLHIVQLNIMHRLTGYDVFAEYAEKWQKYLTKAVFRTAAKIYKIGFKLAYY